MNKIILSIETTCDISEKELDEMNVKHISLSYNNVTTGEENPKLTLKEFYDAIRNGESFKTSLINEFQFEEYFANIVKEGDVLHLGFDGSVSGTCACAKKAAEKINANSTNKVYVVDTLTGSGGQAIILHEVIKKLNEGKTIQELIDFVEDLKTRVSLNFSPEDMKTLAKSGRVSNIVAKIGGVLKVKPIIFLDEEGNFKVRQMVMGLKKSLLKMIEHFKNNYNFESELVYVLHGDKVEDAEFIVNEIKKDDKFRPVKFIIEYLGVIVGAHGGPGNICMTYTAKQR